MPPSIKSVVESVFNPIVGGTGASLSAMVMRFKVSMPAVMPDDGLPIFSMAVSVPSTSASSTTRNVSTPDVAPPGMVMVVLLSV